METKLKHKKPQTFSLKELPAPIRQIKDNSFNMLLKQLGDMFSSCDDLFYNLSDRAKSNVEQNQYFDSMREIRRKKGRLTTKLKRNIDEQYHQLICPTVAPDKQLSDINLNGLSLVENDQLEQKVAISGMVTKVRSNCQESLYFLNCRFDSLIQHLRVNEKNNPLDPENICSAFAEASEILELNIKSRIILFKQFDRFIIAALPRIYDQANRLFVNANVLPNIKFSVKPSPRQHPNNTINGTANPMDETAGASVLASGNSPNSRNYAATIADDSNTSYNAGSFEGDADQAAETGLNELKNLFRNMRDLGVSSPSFIAFIPGYDNLAPAINRHSLLQELSHALPSTIKGFASTEAFSGTLNRNNENTTNKTTIPNNTPNNNRHDDIRTAIKSILIQKNAVGSPKSIHPLDEDAINLVAMFFDFILNDRNIPVQIQAIIGRLQIPVLRIALHDNTFFSSSKHPLRLLINKIAESCIGWSEIDKHHQDKLFEEISQVVNAILAHDMGNKGFLQNLLDDFVSYIDQEDRKSSLVEKRVSQAAVGQVRTKHVRDQVRELIEERTAGKKLPVLISNFLALTWKNILFLINLRNGVDSVEWLDALQVVDDLIWSVQEHNDEKSIKRLKHLLPILYSKISKFLPLATSSNNEADDIISKISVLHNSIMSGVQQELAFSSPKKTEQTASTEAPTAKASQNKDQSMTAVQRQQAQINKLEYKFILMAENLALGSWIEYTARSEQQRYKLMAKVEESDSFIFVKRFGSTIMEKDRKQFARDLQEKNAKLLDRAPVFDRAIRQISENLNRLRTNSE